MTPRRTSAVALSDLVGDGSVGKLVKLRKLETASEIAKAIARIKNLKPILDRKAHQHLGPLSILVECLILSGWSSCAQAY
jgi:hypothetical protein